MIIQIGKVENLVILNIIRSFFIVIIKGLIITIFEYAVATVYQRVALSTRVCYGPKFWSFSHPHN